MRCSHLEKSCLTGDLDCEETPWPAVAGLIWNILWSFHIPSVAPRRGTDEGQKPQTETP
jgi:hypothetical protein